MTEDRPRGVRVIGSNGVTVQADEYLTRAPHFDHNGVTAWVIAVPRELIDGVARIQCDRLPAKTQLMVGLWEEDMK